MYSEFRPHQALGCLSPSQYPDQTASEKLIFILSAMSSTPAKSRPETPKPAGLDVPVQSMGEEGEVSF